MPNAPVRARRPIRGAGAFDQGKWAEAVELFGRAEALVHSPIHLSYIARAQLKLGHWVEAYELFNRIKREPLETPVSTAAANAVADANRQLSTLDAQLPYVTLVVKGSDTRRRDRHDGRRTRAQRADWRVASGESRTAQVPRDDRNSGEPGTSGRHQTRGATDRRARARADRGSRRADRAGGCCPAASRDRAATRAAAGAGPNSSGSALRIGGYIGLGVGVVGVGLGTVFLLSSNSKQKDADNAFEACGGKACSGPDRVKVDALDSDAATGKTLALTSFVVGGVGLATGVTLLVLSGKQKSEPTAQLAPRVQPWIGYRSVGLSGTF